MREKGTLPGELQRGWQRFWRLSWWWKGSIIGVVAFFLLAIVAGIAGGGDEDKSAPLVEATTTASPTETPATDAASETSPPTPTPTPKATATSEPVDNVRVLAYLDDLADLLADELRVISSIGDIAGSANPLSARSEDLALEATVEADILQAQAHDLDPPPALEEVHGWILKSVDSLQASAENFWLAIRRFDIDLLTQSVAEMEETNRYIDLANDAVAKVDTP